MKLLKPIVRISGVAALIISAHANNGLDDYRLGHYDKAAAVLWDKSGKSKFIDYTLGRMQLNGYGMLKNNVEALAHLEVSAKKGYTPAQWFMGRYELTVKHNPEQAYYWFNKLAAKEDIDAQLYVIAARQYGYGVRKEPSRAQKYYIDAAKEGNAIAQYVLAKGFLSSRNSRNRKLGLIWLKKSADKGYARAQFYLGNLYSNGKKVRRDKARAIDSWAQAAENGYFPAMLTLGNLALKQKEYQVAKSWFEKGAKANNPRSMIALSELFMDKDAPFYNPESGFMWTLKAAKLQNAKAQSMLAQLYKEGKGVNADAALAKEWEEKAKKTAINTEKNAAKTKLLSLVSTGKANSFKQTPYYLQGILTNWSSPSSTLQGQYNGAPKMQGIQSAEIFKPKFEITMPDSVKFSEYYNLLAPMLFANGKMQWRFPRYPLDEHIQRLMDNESLVMPHSKWSSMIEQGRPYPQAPSEKWDYLESFTEGGQQRANLYAVVMRLYNQAILGNPEAQFEIGQLYHYGVGLAKSPEQAKIYYELSADQDDVRAEYNLGILYMEGQLGEANYDKGMSWLNDAAFRGNAYAQYALANIYQYGVSDKSGIEVVAPDPQRAMNMYYLSASNHFGPAQYELANYLVSQPNGTLSVAARNNRHKVVEKLYRRAVQQGVADAYLPHAFYQAMHKDKASQESAFSIATKEANKGTPQAALLLGLMYDRGISSEPDNVKALYWYQKADPSPVKSFILGT
jgi:enhanced entry protein EnhC